jgi:uncharacterized protein (TIGR00369 family)
MRDHHRRARHQASPIPFPVTMPFVESLGIELHGFGDGHAELRVDLDEAHLNAWEVAHGGVVMTLLDVAMAMAARSATGHAGGVATIEMKTSFMRPAEHQLRAVAKVLHRSSTLAFCEGSLFDDQGKLCASATGTFKYLRGLAARGRIVSPAAAEAGATRPHTATDTPPTPASTAATESIEEDNT